MKTCNALAETGSQVCLWVPGMNSVNWSILADHYGMTTSFELQWVPVSNFCRRYDFAWLAFNQARKWGAEIIYTWMLQVADLALWRRLPVVLEMHDRPMGRFGPCLFRKFYRHSGKKRLLLVTKALQRKLEEEYQTTLSSAEVQIAPNGTEPERYTDFPDAVTIRCQLDLPEGPMAVYAGHFYAGRGIELLFRLAKRLPAINFLWVGGKPEDVAHWRKRVSEAGLENVYIIGFVENQRLPQYQAAADVLMMPYERAIAGSSGGNSAEICSPMKMFDYLSVGRAIISSDLPVLHEVLHPGNSVFCPPEDLDAWQKALLSLLNDPLRRQQLANQSIVDARRYTWTDRAERAISGLLK